MLSRQTHQRTNHSPSPHTPVWNTYINMRSFFIVALLAVIALSSVSYLWNCWGFGWIVEGDGVVMQIYGLVEEKNAWRTDAAWRVTTNSNEAAENAAVTDLMLWSDCGLPIQSKLNVMLAVRVLQIQHEHVWNYTSSKCGKDEKTILLHIISLWSSINCLLHSMQALPYSITLYSHNPRLSQFSLSQAFAPAPTFGVVSTAASSTSLEACRVNAKKEKRQRNRDNMRKFQKRGKTSRKKMMRKVASSEMRQLENEFIAKCFTTVVEEAAVQKK